MSAMTDLPPRRFPREAVRDYIMGGHASVEGWLLSGAASVIWTLIEAQEHCNVRGDIAEIGLFQGKLFILLCLALREDEIGIGIDPFEYAAFPPYRPNFDANLARMGIGDDMVRIIAQGSETVKAGQLTAGRPNRVRLFSVDGEHTEQAVAHDLRLAEECLADAGVVIIDDIYHPHTPGVTEAVIDYMRGNRADIVPLALLDRQGSLKRGSVKLLACRKHQLPIYRQAIRSGHQGSVLGDAAFCGSPTLLLDFGKGVHKRKFFAYASTEGTAG